jgi:hypothetical protein
MDIKKVVSFYPSVRVYETIHRLEYSTEEIFSTWYDGLEMERICNENLLTIAVMESGKPISTNDEIYCTRGLEHYTRRGKIMKQRRREEAQDAVIDEQECIIHYGEACDTKDKSDHIARVYHTYSKHAENVARRLGCLDEIVARNVYKRQNEIACLNENQSFHPAIQQKTKITFPRLPSYCIDDGRHLSLL